MAYTFGPNGEIIQGPSSQNYLLPQQQATQSNLAGLQASQQADPAGKYKQDWSRQLNELFTNPGSITTSPYYQFARDQGIEAVTRANKGVDSGRYMSELTKFGTGLAGQQFGSLANLYNTAIGGSGPAGAQMQLGGFTRAQDQQSMALGNKQAVQQPQTYKPNAQPFDMNALMSKYGITPQGQQTMPVNTGGGYGLPSGTQDYPDVGWQDSINNLQYFGSPANYDTGGMPAAWNAAESWNPQVAAWDGEQ